SCLVCSGVPGIVLPGRAGPLNPEPTKQHGMVRGSARHLLELINDVLDISKIEAGQLEVRSEPFDLCASVERVTALIIPFAEKKGVALIATVSGELKEIASDRRRVEQILINLLNNALKFTDQGRITLTVETVADYQPSPEGLPRAAIRMRVTDTGIGIKPGDLALLFQPFRQLDTGLARKHEGTGLGLAICRRLAGLLGGEITAHSEWQRGSEFTFILPLEKRN
ncbi:MAG: histidine kinase, partial [Akkermansiaceae bacterium]|nr:histidine kinase [Verrucomicrobiales bacterium]